MNTSDTLSYYIPTIERARQQGVLLPPEEPSSVQRVAALFVYAALLRRRTWHEDVVVPWEKMAQIPRGAPPPPTELTPKSYVWIEREISVDTCTSCAETPGRMKCRVCKGTGSLSGLKVRCSCDAGFVPCPVCRGERLSQRIRLRYFNDEPVYFREAYLPSPLAHVPAFFSFESSFEREAGIEASPSECLRCYDLNDRVTGATAYRGGERRERPDFNGFDFGDTIDKALAGLAAISVGVAVPFYDVRAYAWPILWLRYDEGRDIALYAGRDAVLRSFGANHRS